MNLQLFMSVWACFETLQLEEEVVLAWDQELLQLVEANSAISSSLWPLR